jgi:hypothetical protein
METPSAPPLPLTVENVYNEKAVAIQSGPVPVIPAVPAVLMAEAEPIEEVEEAPYSPLYTSASSGISSLTNSTWSPLHLSTAGDESQIEQQDPAQTTNNNENKGSRPQHIWLLLIRIGYFITSCICLVEGIEASLLNFVSSDGTSIGTCCGGFIGAVGSLWFSATYVTNYSGYMMLNVILIILAILSIICSSISFTNYGSLTACVYGNNDYFHPFQFYGDPRYFPATQECAQQDSFAWIDCNCVNDVNDLCLTNSGVDAKICETMFKESPDYADMACSLAIVHIIATVLLSVLFYWTVTEKDIDPYLPNMTHDAYSATERQRVVAYTPTVSNDTYYYGGRGGYVPANNNQTNIGIMAFDMNSNNRYYDYDDRYVGNPMMYSHRHHPNNGRSGYRHGYDGSRGGFHHSNHHHFGGGGGHHHIPSFGGGGHEIAGVAHSIGHALTGIHF